MRKQIVMLASLLLILVASCSKNHSADVKEIFGTVPSSVSMVAVIDLQKFVEKAGDSLKNVDIKESGVDPGVAVIYADGSTVYATGMISDTGKFRDYFEKKMGGKFVETSGVNVCRTAAYKDSRFWLALKGRSAVDPATVNEFMSLSNAQSFASNDKFADALENSDHDIAGWGDIQGLMNLGNAGFEQRALAMMTLQTVFDDAGFVSFIVDFQKGECDIEANVLNSKGKAAKYNFATEKLDLDAINKIGGNAETLVALAIPRKLVEQIQKATSGTPSFVGVAATAMKCIDGTIAMATDKNGSVDAIVTTTGRDTSGLMSMLGSFGAQSSLEGDYIRVKKGSVTGPMAVSAMSPFLKGACAGAVVIDTTRPDIETVTVTLMPKGGSVTLGVKAVAKNKDANILQVLVPEMKF